MSANLPPPSQIPPPLIIDRMLETSMENPADTIPDDIIDIAPDGDLVLVVGSDKTKLRVHSMLLMAALKPFSAMLGPTWKEGHDLRNRQGPFELLLPEDDAIAMQIICVVIHYQNEKLSRTLAADDIFAVAVAADKYDCVNALRFASESWLRTYGDEPESLVLLAASAYVFQDAPAFRTITGALVLNHVGSYLDLCIDDVESFLPWTVFCLLEEQREHSRLQLLESLVNKYRAMLYCHGCGKARTHLGPADLPYVSISRAFIALNRVDMMTDPVIKSRGVECQCAYNTGALSSDDRKWYRSQVDTLLYGLNKRFGLCLHCIRRGGWDRGCRDPTHSY